MKTHLFGTLFVALVALANSAFAATWNIDDTHASARFKIRHMMVSNVSGEITGFKGTFDLDEKDVTKLKAEAELDANTINTNNAKRDEHLKNADFFDVANHPKITFKSKKVAKGKGKAFKLTGDLTMHGQTKEVTLNADELTPTLKDPWGNMRRGFVAHTKINRKDFGLTWNKTLDAGGLALGEEVEITVELELVQPTEKKDTKS